MRSTSLLLAILLAAPWAASAQEPQPKATRSHAIAILGTPALPADFPYFPYVNPNAPKGGETVFAMVGSFDGFNPFILGGNAAIGTGAEWQPGVGGTESGTAVGHVWESLLVPSADEVATAYGHLAQSIEIPPDRMWAAFEIRPEARFADGTPVTAEDVAWTYDTLREKGRPSFRVTFADVAGVEVQGPRRVVFHFKSNENRELPLLVGGLPVLPKHWWATRDFTKPLTEAPMGSGPYKVESFEMGRTVTYARRDDWWAKDRPTGRGLDNFDRVRIEYYRDPTVAFEAFKAGRVDWREENIARQWATGYDFPAARDGLVRKDPIPHHLPVGVQGFAMNTRRPQFQDPRVRQALGLALDFQWMNKALFYDAYTRTRSYFGGTDEEQTGLPEPDELKLLEPFRGELPPELFTAPFKMPVTDGSGYNREGLRHALQLLEQAGWKVQNRKLVDAEGTQMAFTILLNDPSMERVTLPYVQQLEKLGMAVQVRTGGPGAIRAPHRRLRLRHVADHLSRQRPARHRAARRAHLPGREGEGQQQRHGRVRPGGGLARRAGDPCRQPPQAARRRPCARPGADVALVSWCRTGIPRISGSRAGIVLGGPTSPCATGSCWTAGGWIPPAPRRWMRPGWVRRTRASKVGAYLLRRLLLLLPTLVGIVAINFAIVQLAPGGPVEQALAELKGRGTSATARMSGPASDLQGTSNGYRGAAGLDPKLVADLKRQFGFDKPAWRRFLIMLGAYLRFDFGQSFFRGQSVLHLVLTRMPVSISLGLWSTLLVYLVSIPLGIAKAVRDGSRFDVATSAAVLVGYAVPSFLFAILLAVLFAGGSFVQWFPLRGLTTSGSAAWPWPARVGDYLWHMVLPVTAMVAGGFASLTILTKNSFLEEIRKHYVVTAQAKGAGKQRVLYGHVFRNAMLLIVAGFPSAFLSILFSSALLIEIVFSLDGLGLLGFESAIRRDYPVMFGTLYIFTLFALVLQIIGDMLYTVVDPRIDFEARR